MKVGKRKLTEGKRLTGVNKCWKEQDTSSNSEAPLIITLYMRRTSCPDPAFPPPHHTTERSAQDTKDSPGAGYEEQVRHTFRLDSFMRTDIICRTTPSPRPLLHLTKHKPQERVHSFTHTHTHTYTYTQNKHIHLNDIQRNSSNSDYCHKSIS